MENINTATLVFLVVAFLFFVGSMFGWLLELVFRRFFSNNNPERKWINPGFLVGPYLPLYGFGLCGLFVMSFIPYIGLKSLEGLTWGKAVVAIVAMSIMMTLIEYIAGIVFIKKMHVKLWDYSNEWGNIQGIICPRFSLFWTILAAIYYFFIQPHVINMVAWYFNNIAFTFVVGLFFGVFLVDFGYSVHILSILRKFAQESEIIIRYEELKSHIRHATDEAKEKAHFMFAFKSGSPILEHLESYKEKLINEVAETKAEIKETIQNKTEEIKSTTEEIKNDIKNKFV